MNCLCSDDGNGKLKDKSHGSNCDAGSGYLCNIRQILRHPNELRPVSNGVVTVQEDLSPDCFPEVEANQQTNKSHGKSKKSCHVTRLTIIADLTTVLKINPYVRLKLFISD